MHLSILVISQWILLQAFGHHFIGDDNYFLRLRLYNKFQYIKQFAGISTGEAQHGCCFFQFNFSFLQHGIRSDGTLQKFQQIFFFQRFEYIKLATGQERADDLERRVFRCCTNQRDCSVLYSS